MKCIILFLLACIAFSRVAFASDVVRADTTTTGQPTTTLTAPIMTTTVDSTTTTTTNPCSMSVFCSALPDSAVSFAEPDFVGPDPTGGTAFSPNFVLFSGECALPIHAKRVSTGTLNYGEPAPISSMYPSVWKTPISKAYVQEWGNTELVSGGSVQSCTSEPPKRCKAVTALAIDSNVRAYSTWHDIAIDALFYVVADGTGRNLFVTDGRTLNGSSVGIAFKQSTIQTVTALQHVAYRDPGFLNSHYLYVFGTDAQGAPYFGVLRLYPTGPVNAASTAASLPWIDWVVAPVPYNKIYGAACGAMSSTSNTTTTTVDSNIIAGPCSMSACFSALGNSAGGSTKSGPHPAGGILFLLFVLGAPSLVQL